MKATALCIGPLVSDRYYFLQIIFHWLHESKSTFNCQSNRKFAVKLRLCELYWEPALMSLLPTWTVEVRLENILFTFQITQISVDLENLSNGRVFLACFQLHYAAQMSNGQQQHSANLALEILEIFLQQPNVQVDVCDKDGRQPLLWAASAGAVKAVLVRKCEAVGRIGFH